VQKLFEGLPDLSGGEELGLVLGSVSGELETTADFHLTLSRDNLARPLLFQNSLHNAMTGFVSIAQRLRGPTMTVSAGARTPMESLHMAETLMNESLCKMCLVSLVEVNLRMTELLHFPPVSEGACSLLVTTDAFVEEWRAQGFKSRAILPEEFNVQGEALGWDYPASLHSVDDPRVDLPSSGVWNLAERYLEK
jgi:hypothetical protein